MRNLAKSLDAFRSTVSACDKYLPTTTVSMKRIQIPATLAAEDLDRYKMIVSIKRSGAPRPLIVDTALRLLEGVEYYKCLEQCGIEIAAVVQIQTAHPATIRLLRQFFDLLTKRRMDEKKIRDMLFRISFLAPELTQRHGKFFEMRAKEWFFEHLSAS